MTKKKEVVRETNVSFFVQTVGVSFADTTINQLGLSEFIDNESYSNLEVKKKHKKIDEILKK